METFKMNHLSDSLITALASVCALIFSQISITLPDDNIMKWITAISSVVLLLTAIIKLIDLCTEKIPKWSAAITKRFRKPPTA